MRSDGLAAHGLAALLALALGLWALGVAARPAPERTLALLLLLQAACIGLAPRLTGVRLALWPLLLCGWAVLGWVLPGGQLLRGPAASTLAFLALQLATLAAWQRLLGADDDARPARRAALLAAWVLLVASPLWALPSPQWALQTQSPEPQCAGRADRLVAPRLVLPPPAAGRPAPGVPGLARRARGTVGPGIGGSAGTDPAPPSTSLES
jgi:hypothetical protein